MLSARWASTRYWYPVGWANQLKPGDIIPVTIWQQTIAVYRDTNGQIHALENVCPHKGVALHKAKSKVVTLLVVIMAGNLTVKVIALAFPIFLKNKSFPSLSAVIQSRKI